MKNNKRLLAKFVLLLFCAFFFQVFSLIHPKNLDSANLTSVKDTLSNSRLSFVGALGTGNTAGSSSPIIISTDLSSYGWADSDKNYNLFPGDTLMVGSTTNYTVDGTIDDTTDDKIQLTAVLNAGDADIGDPVIATASATHALIFTTIHNIANGAIRIKIPSAAGGHNDGIPDPTGFDYGPMTAGDVTCPTGGGVDSWESATATAAASWHTFECRYNGVLAPTALTMTVGGTNKLINPSPSDESETRTPGSADTYSFVVEHRDNNYNVTDASTGKIAVVEAVRVTATVEPTITFTITGITADSGAYCGVTRTSSSPDSTGSTVPFGALTLSAFNDAQQQIECVTNGAGGYVVTMIEDDQLSIGGDHTTELQDTDCDNDTCTNTVNDEWSSGASEDVSGFGFSIQNVDATNVALEYDGTGGTCTGTFCARQIPATADGGGDVALNIMNSNGTTPTVTETMYMCYRIAISPVQVAADYQNYITYVATATF